jgi:molybdopterin-dependent oxidoreductase alpha subunit
MWNPSQWVSMVPTGLNDQKPRHYREMLRVAWANRDQLPFAWRILRDGVCDGCALGTSGLSDWTIPGVHLCMVRLELMRLNTAPAIDSARLASVAPLERLTSAQLRGLGRLAHPMIRHRGEMGFHRITWDEAMDHAAGHLRSSDPHRVAFYLTSRGITNEVYYAAQKAARFLGTNHVDNSARLCHAASTVAMKEMLGYGASTCSYSDWLGADLIVFFGSNTPNNQPVTTKYLFEARRNGAAIAVVNPFREPGLERYWVPSIAESALFGTRFADEWFDVNTGGDLAFLTGTLRALLESGDIDRQFIERSTSGFEATRDRALAADWPALEAASGLPRARMQDFARMLVEKPNAILVWSMGLTQHVHGVDTIRELVNVGLARGLLGRPNRGLMPIRGHSGVQGGAEVGCSPAVDPVTRDRWAREWKFPVPAEAGLTAAQMVARSADGAIDVFWIVGGNFLETLPDEQHIRRALARPRLRIHQDIVVSSSMLAESDGDVLLLPATTRYESVGGGTETSTERRIIFSPEIPGRRVGEARSEWQVFGETMARVRPEDAHLIHFESAAAIRDEIARTVPLYRGIETLSSKGDQVQWGGRTLFADGRFATADGKARFRAVGLRAPSRPDTSFLVSTRRGKQFNSMVKREIDPLTGAGRDAVLINRDDAARLGVANGQRIRLVSESGSFEGRALHAAIKAGNLEVHWPEGNVLLPGDSLDPESLEPDYNATVTIERVG